MNTDKTLMTEPDTTAFLRGKSATSVALFECLIHEFQQISTVTIHPAKTMIGIATSRRRIAWVTAFGKNFLHVVFPFEQPYNDNLCFQKIAQVPGNDRQYNHHFRMMAATDINEEVQTYMRLACEASL